MNMDESTASDSKELAKHAANYAPALLVPAVVNLLLISILTRIFEPMDFGYYSLSISSSVLLTVILSFWIQQSILRYMPEYVMNGKLDEFKKEIGLIFLVITIIFVVVSILLHPIFLLMFKVYDQFYYPTIFLTICTINYKGLISIYLSLQESKKYLIYQTLQALIFFILFMSFLLISKDILSIIFATGFAQLVIVLFMIRDLDIFNFKNYISKPNFLILKNFISYGFPMIGWFLSAQLMNLSDRFVIGIYRGSAEVGIYDSNYRIVAFGIGLLATPLINSAYPIIMKSYESGDDKKTIKIISLFSRYYLILTLPFVLIVTVLSREIVTLILGASYREGYIIMPVILLGHVAWQFSFYGQKTFELMKATRIIFIMGLLCAALNLILNVILVNQWGYFGAAIATLISYLVYLFLIFIFSKNMHLRWQMPWGSLLNTSISSVFASVFLIPIIIIQSSNLFLISSIILISLCIYFYALYKLNEFDQNEIYALKDISTQIKHFIKLKCNKV